MPFATTHFGRAGRLVRGRKVFLDLMLDESVLRHPQRQLSVAKIGREFDSRANRVENCRKCDGQYRQCNQNFD